MADLLARHLDWCRLRSLRPATVDQRRYTIRRLAAWLGFPPEEATAQQLSDWYATLIRLTPESRGTELAHVRQYFKWLQAEGVRYDEPTVRLPRPRSRPRLPRPITDVDLEVAIMTADNRVRAMLVLAAYAGLRAGEIARLRREDILDGQTPPMILVVDGKGGKQRLVPLHPEIEVELQLLPARGYLFLKADVKGGGPLLPHSVSQMCNNHLHALGITSTLHQARHWFGTNVYRASKDLRMTQDLMGHNSPVSTAGYAAWAGDGSEVVRELRVS